MAVPCKSGRTEWKTKIGQLLLRHTRTGSTVASHLPASSATLRNIHLLAIAERVIIALYLDNIDEPVLGPAIFPHPPFLCHSYGRDPSMDIPCTMSCIESCKELVDGSSCTLELPGQDMIRVHTHGHCAGRFMTRRRKVMDARGCVSGEPCRLGRPISVPSCFVDGECCPRVSLLPYSSDALNT